MPSRPPRVHAWRVAEHRGCVVCTPLVDARHSATLAGIRRVAASLHAPALVARQAACTKQETPGLAGPGASTAHPVCDTEVRAAGAQSDTLG